VNQHHPCFRHQRFRRSFGGFTLVELLVVIAIIGVLVALLLPAVQAAREAARRTQCQSNLKQVTLAILNYSSARSEELPPGGITNGRCCNTRSKENWAISILPYLEQSPLYDQYRFDLFNEDPLNQPVLQTILSSYLCPSDEDTQELATPESGPGNGILMARGSYRANTGRCGDPVANAFWDSPNQAGAFSNIGGRDVSDLWRGPFHSTGAQPSGVPYKNVESIPKLRQITDGLSNTMFIGEMTSQATRSSNSALVRATPRRRTFWAYTYTSYNKSCAVPQTRTLLVDYGRCVEVGGSGGSDACKRAWGALHPGGLHFSFGDGSVRFLNTSIDMQIFAEMATMAGGEIAVN